jgi:SNF2 family DNA or RNA helicase
MEEKEEALTESPMPTRDNIIAAAEALAEVCDGAVSQDGRGYNGMDAVVAKSILKSKIKTDRQIRSLWNILRKYHGQLEGLGVIYEALVPPPIPVAGQDDRRVYEERGIAPPPPKREGILFVLSQAGKNEVVTLQFEYDKRLVGLVQKLPKRGFDKDGSKTGVKECWFIPTDLQNIQLALRTFQAIQGLQVEVAPNVQEILDRAGKVYKESRSDGVEFVVPTKLPLYSFQSAGVKWIDDRKGRAFVADDMGLGKTPTALGWLALRRETALPALVLVPATLRVNWIREAAKFTDFKCLLLSGPSSLKQFKKLGLDVSDMPVPGYDVTLLNYDLLSVETPKTWLKMLLKGEELEQAYGARELAEAGRQALVLLEKAMAKAVGIEMRNRIWKVVTKINDLGDEARGLRSPRHQQVFVNGHKLEEFLKAGYKTLILDESHYCKDTDAQRTMAAQKLSVGMAHAICLSGTPILNRPKEIWSQTQIVNPKLFPKFWDFGLRFCNGHQTPFGWDFTGSSNLEELDKILRSTIMIRRTKDQVLKELPEKSRVTIPFIIEEKLEKRYRKEAEPALQRIARLKQERDEWKAVMSTMELADQRKFLASHAADAARKGKLKGMIVQDLEKVKQAALNVKLDQSIKFILDTHEQQGKILVFATHHETIDKVKDALEKEGVKVGVIDGRVDPAGRDPIKDAFQEGDTEILVCGIRAASEGLTLTASSTVIFLECDWNPSRHDQAESRVHRIGQKNAVTIYYLVALGTVEESIVRMIDAKREVVNSAMGESDKTLEEDGILDSILDSVLEGVLKGIAA